MFLEYGTYRFPQNVVITKLRGVPSKRGEDHMNEDHVCHTKMSKFATTSSVSMPGVLLSGYRSVNDTAKIPTHSPTHINWQRCISSHLTTNSLSHSTKEHVGNRIPRSTTTYRHLCKLNKGGFPRTTEYTMINSNAQLKPNTESQFVF